MDDFQQSIVPLFPHLSCGIVRFYVNCPASHLLLFLQCWTSTASSWSQCSPPDVNCKLLIAVAPAGPQLQALDRSVPRRTSTASSWSQCSPPDLNCKLLIAAVPADLNCNVLLAVVLADPAGQRVSEDKPVTAPDIMSENMCNKMWIPDILSDNLCLKMLIGEDHSKTVIFPVCRSVIGHKSSLGGWN